MQKNGADISQPKWLNDVADGIQLTIKVNPRASRSEISGLEDEWLNRLNSLSVFELRSICEGHVFEGPAHITLKVKKELYATALTGLGMVAMYLDFPESRFELKLDTISDAEFKAIWLKVEFCRENQYGHTHFENYTRRHAWPKCEEWFPLIVEKLEEIDKTLHKVISD